MKENLGGIRKLPKQAPNPFITGYAPELDTSPVMDPSLESSYQSQIRFLRWMVELSWGDINTEVSMLAS